MVDFSNLSSSSNAAVTVRVATPVEEGRAGLAYPGLNPDGLITDPAFITGLRQIRPDRSNLAVQNAGDANITLKVTVFSGGPASAGRSVALPDRTLPREASISTTASWTWPVSRMAMSRSNE